MTPAIDYDRRTPLPENHVFEAHDAHDPTNNRFLYLFRDPENEGVAVNFLEDTGHPSGLHVHDMMWLDAEQCEALAAALVGAATTLRAAA